MAEDGFRVQAQLDASSRLGEQWEQHRESFDTDSEALREALRESLCDEDTGRDVTRGVRAGLITLLVIVLGQAWLVYGPETALPLLAMALLIFAITLTAPTTPQLFAGWLRD